MEQKFEDVADTGEMELTEDYIVLDDVASSSHLDLSNLRKRKTKIISSAKETIENGKFNALLLMSEEKNNFCYVKGLKIL